MWLQQRHRRAARRRWFDRHADPADGLLVTSCYGDWMVFNIDSGNSGSSKLTRPAAVTAFYYVRASQLLSEVRPPATL